jgi:cob(I)alamin adenosyltransferase
MGFRLSKIYTRTGDSGQTGLSDGLRVAKDHPRIEAIGEIDSLNCVIGVLLAELQQEQASHPGLAEIQEALAPCQHRLFDVGGELSMPAWEALQIGEVERLEAHIDRWNEQVGPLKDFILPGGSRLIALAHQARAAARTAERRCQTLNQSEPLRPVLLAYINRLSDFLFVAARLVALRQDCPEVLWVASKPE